MTETTIRTRAGIAAWISRWIGRRQRQLSDQLQAAGDERARHHDWEVMESTGRFGFGVRTYRDPCLNNRRQSCSARTRAQRCRHGSTNNDHCGRRSPGHQAAEQGLTGSSRPTGPKPTPPPPVPSSGLPVLTDPRDRSRERGQGPPDLSATNAAALEPGNGLNRVGLPETGSPRETSHATTTRPTQHQG
jgi:hypothetical protein